MVRVSEKYTDLQIFTEKRLTDQTKRTIEIWELLGTIYFPFVGKIVRVLTYYLVTSHVMMIHTTMTDLSIDCAEYCEKIIGRQKKTDENEELFELSSR